MHSKINIHAHFKPKPAPIMVDIFGTPITNAAIHAKALQIAHQIKLKVDKGLISKPVLLLITEDAWLFTRLIQQSLMALKCRHHIASTLANNVDGTCPRAVTLTKSLDEFTGQDVIVVQGNLGTGEKAFRCIMALQKNYVRTASLACLINHPEELTFPVTIDYPTFHVEKESPTSGFITASL